MGNFAKLYQENQALTQALFQTRAILSLALRSIPGGRMRILPGVLDQTVEHFTLGMAGKEGLTPKERTALLGQPEQVLDEILIVQLFRRDTPLAAEPQTAPAPASEGQSLLLVSGGKE